MQAIILAAGMGKRLKELTNDSTKCMIKVNNITLIERMLNQLDKLSLTQIIIVVGYKADTLIEFVSGLKIKTPIIYINNEIYYKTNNIYSLYLAKDYLLKQDTLLLESDLIFEDRLLEILVNNSYHTLALVAKYESWMDGTVVTLDNDNCIKSFLGKREFSFDDINKYYKTINIYKFSIEFSNTHYVPFLEAYTKALGDNEYYEQVLKVIALLEKPEIKALPIEGLSWYEIDDIQDLDIAESIFSDSESEKLKKIEKRYGGYWRYPNMLDFCYLVNPYYPPEKLKNEIKASFNLLLESYPSGQGVNSLLAAKYFGVKNENISVGNGAAELIKGLLESIKGKIGIILPTFEEYPNRNKDIVSFIPNNKDYSYTSSDIINYFNNNQISSLVLINPDNPSGNYLNKDNVISLLEWSKQKNIQLILDESFIDFSDENVTFISQEILNTYQNLIVIKSISKSFGVPGIRLGIAASGNLDLIKYLKKDISIWNINSFGEYFLQIFEKYKDSYSNAINKFKTCRKTFYSSLENIKNLRVISTQSNFIMCEIKNNMTSLELTEKLLSQYNILIKNLSSKNGISGEYIRVSIKKQEENIILLNALIDLLK